MDVEDQALLDATFLGPHPRKVSELRSEAGQNATALG